ncbi:hypothetical protein PP1Y_Lpl1736 (plasmid) [Novosphingobium sp. PP1Y]|nr:hypothetical protein PP1Y_Lpl1736 [Novosphingobium sp. PP1Y]
MLNVRRVEYVVVVVIFQRRQLRLEPEVTGAPDHPQFMLCT